jgi:hypothetical protein
MQWRLPGSPHSVRACGPAYSGAPLALLAALFVAADPLWDELFPAEQARIVRLLVERVDVGPDGAEVRLRLDGLASLVRDLGTSAGTDLRVAA